MSAASADEQRASVNYKIHCQGCHLADAAGLADEVPGMKDFVGYFAHSQEGREFLVRVPGVATAALPDDQLAELLNWLLVHFSAAELPAGFVPFTVAEVAALRLDLVQDPATSRKRILREIADKEPSLANLIGEQGGR
jgi:hypothetical protein